MKKLDKLTLEEVAMASAQLLKVTHDIHNVVTVVADGVEGVEQKVEVVAAQAEDIKCDVQAISDQVEGVDKKLQVLLDGESMRLAGKGFLIRFYLSRRQESSGGS